MAKFPIYDQQTGTTAVSQVSPIAATQSQDIPQGLSQLSSGINQLGNALHGVAVDNANEQIKQQQEKDTAWASNVANQYTLQQMQNFQKYSETSDPSGNGFYDGWNKQQQEGHEKLLASAGTEQQKKLLSHLTASTNLHFNEKALTQQTQSSENYKLSNIMSSGKSAAQIAAADPAQANTLIAQYTKVVTESINDPLKAAKLIEQGRNDIINAAYDTEINQNPQGVINKLTNDKSFKTQAAKTVFNTSNAFGVDPVLTSFVIGQESGFNNNAKSNTSSAKGIG
ncbi:MAG: hypothetical protein K2Y14_13880 [Burkholderiales bacterium]|nr:hypothetical protein [Burkholderiales bacterium]